MKKQLNMNEVFNGIIVNDSTYYVISYIFFVLVSITLIYRWWVYFKSRRLVRKSRISPILPSCPKHKIQNRSKVIESIHSKFAEIRDRCPDHDTVIMVYLEGPPGFGKTQVARLFAKEFYDIHVS